MASGQPGTVLRQFDRLFGEGTVAGWSEAELLRRFARSRDEAAFEALLARHGPMVLGVCRRILGDGHAVDDAFQAVFLILVKKAGSIRDGGRLGPWLHGVARRVATRARGRAARRRAVERPVAEEADVVAASTGGGDRPGSGPDGGDLERAELRAVLDEEIGRLPERLRAPVVLCYLEGLTHDEAADRLGWPVGTVRSRMAGARDTLRRRLTRRGLAAPAGLLATAVGLASSATAAASPSPAVPAALHQATLRAALHVAAGPTASLAAVPGVVSGGASELARGVLQTMFANKLKLAALVLGTLGVSAGGGLAVVIQAAGLGTGPGPQAPGDPAKAKGTDPRQLRDTLEELRTLHNQRAELEARIRDLEADLRRLGGQPNDGPPPDAEPKAVAGRARVAAPAAPGGQQAGGGSGVGGLGGAGGAAAGQGGFAPGSLGGIAGRAGGAGLPGAGGFPGGRGGMQPAGAPGFGPGGGFGGVVGDGMPTIMSAKIIAVQPRESRKVFAYSTETGEWKGYELPAGVSAVPIVSTVLALALEGDAIRQVAVFDPITGNWHPHDLDEPVQGQAQPVIAAGLVAYGLGRRVYAYSAEAHRWDTLTLPEGSEPAAPVVHAMMVLVEARGTLSTFSSRTGQWTTFDTKGGDGE